MPPLRTARPCRAATYSHHMCSDTLMLKHPSSWSTYGACSLQGLCKKPRVSETSKHVVKPHRIDSNSEPANEHSSVHRGLTVTACSCPVSSLERFYGTISRECLCPTQGTVASRRASPPSRPHSAEDDAFLRLRLAQKTRDLRSFSVRTAKHKKSRKWTHPWTRRLAPTFQKCIPEVPAKILS